MKKVRYRCTCNSDALHHPIPGRSQDVIRFTPDSVNPQSPGKPTPVSDEKVAKEMELTYGHRHGENSVEDFVSLFRQARTSRGLSHLVFSALAILQHAHHGEVKELAQRIVCAYGEASSVLGIMSLPNYGGNGECDIDFDNAATLSAQITGDDPQALYTHPSWKKPCGDGILTIDPPVSAYVVDVVEVQISNAGTSLACGPDWITSEPGPCPVDMTPIFLDDFSISP